MLSLLSSSTQFSSSNSILELGKTDNPINNKRKYTKDYLQGEYNIGVQDQFNISRCRRMSRYIPTEEVIIDEK
jgi:hypothetical protein